MAQPSGKMRILALMTAAVSIGRFQPEITMNALAVLWDWLKCNTAGVEGPLVILSFDRRTRELHCQL